MKILNSNEFDNAIASGIVLVDFMLTGVDHVKCYLQLLKG